MTLSERERYVLLCIIYAANEASEHTDHTGIYAGTPQYDYWITDTVMRSLLSFLDLHLVVITDNSKAIEKLTGCKPQIFHDEYLFHFHDCQRSDQSEITLQEAGKLHDRMKAELKEYIAEHKSKPQMLYISDCHFYHDNLCRNLDTEVSLTLRK